MHCDQWRWTPLFKSSGSGWSRVPSSCRLRCLSAQRGVPAAADSSVEAAGFLLWLHFHQQRGMSSNYDAPSRHPTLPGSPAGAAKGACEEHTCCSFLQVTSFGSTAVFLDGRNGGVKFRFCADEQASE